MEMNRLLLETFLDFNLNSPEAVQKAQLDDASDEVCFQKPTDNFRSLDEHVVLKSKTVRRRTLKRHYKALERRRVPFAILSDKLQKLGLTPEQLNGYNRSQTRELVNRCSLEMCRAIWNCRGVTQMEMRRDWRESRLDNKFVWLNAIGYQRPTMSDLYSEVTAQLVPAEAAIDEMPESDQDFKGFDAFGTWHGDWIDGVSNARNDDCVVDWGDDCTFDDFDWEYDFPDDDCDYEMARDDEIIPTDEILRRFDERFENWFRGMMTIWADSIAMIRELRVLIEEGDVTFFTDGTVTWNTVDAYIAKANPLVYTFAMALSLV